MARAGVRRTVACGRAKSAWPLGAHGHDAIRAWSSLFTQSDQSALARNLVHADRLERGALCAADRGRLVPALGGGVGAHRSDVVGAVRRRASGRSNEAGLSRDSSTARETAPRACAGAGAGAVTRPLKAIVSAHS